MPGFAPGFTDSEVARIAAYLRRTRTSLPPWTDLDQTIATVRRQIDAARRAERTAGSLRGRTGQLC
jgi:hypothetical protein